MFQTRPYPRCYNTFWESSYERGEQYYAHRLRGYCLSLSLSLFWRSRCLSLFPKSQFLASSSSTWTRICICGCSTYFASANSGKIPASAFEKALPCPTIQITFPLSGSLSKMPSPFAPHQPLRNICRIAQSSSSRSSASKKSLFFLARASASERKSGRLPWPTVLLRT
jgi:hypothetical protein